MAKIVMLDNYALSMRDIDMTPFNALGEVVIYERTPEELVVERSIDADVLLINKITMSEAVLQQLPKLRMICVAATGYNVVDIEACRKRNIIVSNAPDYSTLSVAQTVFSHLLNITSHTDTYCRQNREGMWCECPDFCYCNYPTSDLAEKVMGIIGYGHIGSRVAAIAQAFGMKVWIATSKDASTLPKGMEKKEVEELFAGADIVSLHVPLTPDNHEMVSKRLLSIMKPTAILINTARGGLVDETALSEALKHQQIKAYAADVLTHEPASKDCPLWNLPNVYLTPHIAWASYEARKRLFQICLDNVRGFLEGNPVHVVS